MPRRKRKDPTKMTEPQAVDQDAIAPSEETGVDVELEEMTFMTAQVETTSESEAQSEPEGTTWPQTRMILLSELIKSLTISSDFAALLEEIGEDGGLLQEDGTDTFVRLIIAPNARLEYSSMIRLFPDSLPKERLSRSLTAGLRQIANGGLEAVWIGSETALLMLREP